LDFEAINWTGSEGYDCMAGSGLPHCTQIAVERGVMEPQARHILCEA
jgi:hypothetical protein